MQVSPVTMSHPSLPCCSTLFATGYKRLTEGEHEAFCFGLLLEAFACGFWLFDVRGHWKGKELLQGKELKENC
jgi:hypothetical protein